MECFDYLVRSDDAKQALDFAKKLGWSGICSVRMAEDFKNIKPGPDLAAGFYIEAKDHRSLRNTVQSMRRKAEILVVGGTSMELVRAAVETPETDMLLIDWRLSQGVDHVIANIAKENNVAVTFDFISLLQSQGRDRIQVFSNMLKAAKAVKRSGAPFALVSGAKSVWDLRSPNDLLSFGRLLGFDDRSLKHSLSKDLIMENRKRLSGKWVIPGVEVE